MRANMDSGFLHSDNGNQSFNPSEQPSFSTFPEISAQKQDSSLSRRHSSLREDGGLSRGKRLSIETGSSEYDYLTRSPLMEPDHAPAPSGLPRIRQRPLSRAPSMPLTSASSATSLITSPSQSHASSAASGPDHESHVLEDLHRFPSESLHSFSFNRHSEELLSTRYNVLRRTIDFMRDRFGWAGSNAGIAHAQAKLSDDPEVQSMVHLVARANLQETGKGHYRIPGFPTGPTTGPADTTGENVFEKAFASPSIRPVEDGEPPEDLSLVSDSDQLAVSSDEQRTPRARGLKSAPASRRVSLKRTYTDIGLASLHNKLVDAMSSQPYSATDFVSPGSTTSFAIGTSTPGVHSHSSRWSPASQAVFRTESTPRWTILAANDLACLVFGVTQREFRKLSILDLVQKERREWLETKLKYTSAQPETSVSPSASESGAKRDTSRSSNFGSGVTAHLLSKPPARLTRSRGRNDSHSSHGSNRRGRSPNHASTKSRGVLICGDVVPIQKRNGLTGSASLWVMEKKGGLIWVVEEVPEHVVRLRCDQHDRVVEAEGDVNNIWSRKTIESETSIRDLLPRLPTLSGSHKLDFAKINELKYFTALTSSETFLPTTVTAFSESRTLRVSSFPHIAGMLVLSFDSLNIISANPVFAASLFGYHCLEGVNINDLIPSFDQFLKILTEHDNIPLVDGMVIPEHGFRKARATSILRDENVDAASLFLRPAGLPAQHRDGAEIMVDVQMRIVKSQSSVPWDQHAVSNTDGEYQPKESRPTQLVFALWITYSRQFHSTTGMELPPINPLVHPPEAPPPQPAPGQVTPAMTPAITPLLKRPSMGPSTESWPLQKSKPAVSETTSGKQTQSVPELKLAASRVEPPKKKSISDFIILEELGSGAYGQVKLARCKWNPTKKTVLKYVTKKRILMDTWTRDRRLGTVPLEIHVLDFLRRDGMKHPNIVEMEGFFEDDVNYYIEMAPHGFPGMDLFDFVELRTHMDEMECRKIFSQVVSAVHHLHTKALIVHRDIKDENVVMDGDGQVKLIDFGSASYIRNGPFDVFVGTIDYAAPEVLQGHPYRGKEQDVWALGILLYTIIYKENPFYNINEIMDHPLRVPFLPFTEECLDLIRGMLNRNVEERLNITQVAEHPWIKATTNNPGHG